MTRSLLGYLAIAGPFYLLVSLIQALIRPGFNLAEHEWSLLAVGEWGWIQSLNLGLTGAMTIAGAVGLIRALPAGVSGRRAAGLLLVGYGAAVIAAGIFRADAANGFPIGTPPGMPDQPTPHGLLHLVFGSIGFLSLILTCLLIGRIAARRSQRGAALVSWTVGALFTCSFAGIASGAGNAVVNIAFTMAVIVSYGWLTVVAIVLYRDTRIQDRVGGE